MSCIDEINFEQMPSVAILPIGTGNDLGRTLGWGHKYVDEPIELFLRKVVNGNELKLDRWSVQTKPLNNSQINSNSNNNNNNNNNNNDPSAVDKLPVSVANNYFGIGADAKVSLDFHLARGKKFKYMLNFLILKLK